MTHLIKKIKAKNMSPKYFKSPKTAHWKNKAVLNEKKKIKLGLI